MCLAIALQLFLWAMHPLHLSQALRQIHRSILIREMDSGIKFCFALNYGCASAGSSKALVDNDPLRDGQKRRLRSSEKRGS